MDKQTICSAYQTLLRQAYPRVIVLPDKTEWNPYRDECFDAFFVPDSAAGAEYYDHWSKQGGWYDQIDAMGLPHITLSPVYDSQVRKHYAHLFPEFANEKASGTAKSKKSKPVAKTLKSRVARNNSAAAKR